MVKQDVLLDLLPEGGWIDLHKPRLTPLKNEELTLYQRFLLFLMLKVGKARCPNIFRTMFRNLRVYFPFARFNATVMPKGELSRRHTELCGRNRTTKLGKLSTIIGVYHDQEIKNLQ